MRKRVYLFELDSVRMTDQQAASAWEAICREVVVNGNIVVLTFNQLADSRLMMSIMLDRKCQDSFLRLFRNGSIQISQFGSIKTPSQYLQNSLQPGKPFAFTSLPVKSTQENLKKVLCDALKNSDLTELRAYLDAAEQEAQPYPLWKSVWRRFAEGLQNKLSRFGIGERSVDIVTSQPEKKKDRSDLLELFEETGSVKTRMTYTEMYAVLNTLFHWMYAIMQISMMDEAYVPPKTDDPDQGGMLTLYEILTAVLQWDGLPGDIYWNPAVDLIKSLETYYEDQSSLRSAYHDELRNRFQSEGVSESERPVYQYAQAIVDQCYNFTCELSVSGVSIHYEQRDIFDHSAASTFRCDFMNRLQQDWEDGGDRNARYLYAGAKRFHPFAFSENRSYVRYLKSAARFSEYNRFEEFDDSAGIYEADLDANRKQHRKKARRTILVRFAVRLFLFALSVLITVLLDEWQNLLESSSTLHHIVWLLVFLVISEILNWLLRNIVPSLSRSAMGLAGLAEDLWYLWRAEKTADVTADVYVNAALLQKPAASSEQTDSNAP